VAGKDLADLLAHCRAELTNGGATILLNDHPHDFAAIDDPLRACPVIRLTVLTGA
jgi:hypothetical protein